MRVFISWSGNNAKKIAQKMKEELSVLFGDSIAFWVSSEDIGTGNISANEILHALKDSKYIIVVLDGDNHVKPWINFETGFVLGNNYEKNTENLSSVFPIVFGNLDIKKYDNTPFKIMQLCSFSKSSIKKLLESIKDKYYMINSEMPCTDHSFQKMLPVIYKNINAVANKILKTVDNNDDTIITKDNIIEKLNYYHFPKPLDGTVIQYNSGFETNHFYEFLLNNVKKRLYIFGRKNSKISDRTYNESFGVLLDNKVDMRILYLDPDSEYSKDYLAQDTKDFRSQLIVSIKKSFERFSEFGYKMSNYCRLYSEIRKTEIVVADNVVLFKDIELSSNGRPYHLTDCSFQVTSVDNTIGTSYYNAFMRIWEKNSGKEISNQYINSLI